MTKINKFEETKVLFGLKIFAGSTSSNKFKWAYEECQNYNENRRLYMKTQSCFLSVSVLIY